MFYFSFFSCKYYVEVLGKWWIQNRRNWSFIFCQFLVGHFWVRDQKAK